MSLRNRSCKMYEEQKEAWCGLPKPLPIAPATPAAARASAGKSCQSPVLIRSRRKRHRRRARCRRPSILKALAAASATRPKPTTADKAIPYCASNASSGKRQSLHQLPKPSPYEPPTLAAQTKNLHQFHSKNIQCPTLFSQLALRPSKISVLLPTAPARPLRNFRGWASMPLPAFR